MKKILSTYFCAILLFHSFSYGLGLKAPIDDYQEIGSNDFRISFSGPNDNDFYGGYFNAVAYNSQEKEFLVAWVGNDDKAPLINGESEILVRRISAVTGDILGPNYIRISNVKPEGAIIANPSFPSVAYNPNENTYLVVWVADENDGPREIYGQLLNEKGEEIGKDDFRISDMGADDLDFGFQVYAPKVAHDSVNNRYLVVWTAEDDTPPLVNGEREIFGQLLDKSGNEIGQNDFRISDMGVDGESIYIARNPAITFNPNAEEYLVVWEGEDNENGVVDDEFEIFAQRIDKDGNEVGVNDFKVSQTGPDGDAIFDAERPDVAYNPDQDEYLVIWHSDVPALGDNHDEVRGQRLTSTGVQIGPDDFRISTMPGDGPSESRGAKEGKVVYVREIGEYVVVFEKNVTFDNEIYLQHVNAVGQPLLTSPKRVTNMGPEDQRDYYAINPALAVAPNLIFIGFDGHTDLGGQALGKGEIYGQFYGSAFISSPADPSQNTVNNTLVYPNPFRPSQGHTQMNFSNLPVDAKIRVLDVKGALVRELVADNAGTATWDVKNEGGEDVASGIYFVYLADGSSDKVVKIAVQR